jgi:hypothetical protein
MNALQDVKFVRMTQPQEESSTPTTDVVDTAGFNYATIIIALAEVNATFANLKLQHSDSSGSGFTDIDGADFNGDTTIDGTAAALPTASSDNTLFVIEVDLRNKKRYLDLVADPGAGDTGITAICILSESDRGLTTATERGATAILRV